MNQMQKRLEIIKMAISMTDEDTIKLQLLKLEHFENDNDLGEIIALLKQKHYAKAQEMICSYNIKSYDKAETKINIQSEKEHNINDADCKSNTNNVNTIIKEFSSIRESTTHPIMVKITKSYVNNNNNNIVSLDSKDKNDLGSQKIDTTNSYSSSVNESANLMYERIPDIFTIFHNLALHYYRENNTIISKSAETWMKHISNSKYSDNEIYKIQAHAKKLKNKGSTIESAQLMLACGATKSNLGRLLFARELIKGDLFEKNENEAFELIRELAISEYDEAICDYGQLIEYGIGTKADSKHAEKLYKEAMDLGSERGKRLYETIRKKNNKFLSFFSN